MKKLFLATVSVVALAGSAMAADMPVYKAAPVVAAPACAQFGGLYVGANAGWAYYDYRYNDLDGLAAGSLDTALPSTVTQTDDGFNGGVQAGWNVQTNCTVFGIEADWSWGSIGRSDIHLDGDQGDHAPDTVTVGSKLKSFGTLRTRAGIVVDNLLLYVTGGLAAAKFDRAYSFYDDDPDESLSFSDSSTRWGWTAGFGTEWAWTPNIRIKSEVLYMRFAHDTLTFTGDGCVAYAIPYRFDNDDSVWVTRIGVNYSFGGAAPVVARY